MQTYLKPFGKIILILAKNIPKFVLYIVLTNEFGRICVKREFPSKENLCLNVPLCLNNCSYIKRVSITFRVPRFEL